MVVDITRIPVYSASGFLGSQFYYYIPILFITAIIGSFIGRKIVNKIPQSIFRKTVLIALALISIKFIFDGLNSML